MNKTIVDIETCWHVRCGGDILMRQFSDDDKRIFNFWLGGQVLEEMGFLETREILQESCRVYEPMIMEQVRRQLGIK